MAVFPLKILTPDGVAFDGSVSAVSCRTINGQIQLLAKHIDYCTALGMGEAHLTLEDGTIRRAACMGGMLSMLLLVPVVIIGAYMVEKDSPFWLSAAGTGVTMFASMGVVMLIISALTGMDIVTALSQILQQAFADPRRIRRHMAF